MIERGFIFILIYFEWRDTENQQYFPSFIKMINFQPQTTEFWMIATIKLHKLDTHICPYIFCCSERGAH